MYRRVRAIERVLDRCLHVASLVAFGALVASEGTPTGTARRLRRDTARHRRKRTRGSRDGWSESAILRPLPGIQPPPPPCRSRPIELVAAQCASG